MKRRIVAAMLLIVIGVLALTPNAGAQTSSSPVVTPTIASPIATPTIHSPLPTPAGTRMPTEIRLVELQAR